MRISRNLKKSTMRQRVCELLYTSAVQVYNHGRLSWREITYLVSSFFLFSLSVHASSRSTYINHFHPRTLSPHISKIRWTKREKKKVSGMLLGRNGKKEEGEKDGRRGTRNKGVHYMPPGVAALPLFLLRDVLCVTHGDSLDYHLSFSLSQIFPFFFIFEQLSLRVPPFLSNRFLSAFFFFFFFTNCNDVNDEKKTKPNLSLSL